MDIFTNIPVRENGRDVEASWFNGIRTALVNFASQFFAGAVAETPFTIPDDTSTYTKIEGLSFSSATYSSFKAQYTIYRFNGTDDERREVGYITAGFKANENAWEYSRRTDLGGDALNMEDSLIVASIDQTTHVDAELHFKSDAMGGGVDYFGQVRIKVLEVFLRES